MESVEYFKKVREIHERFPGIPADIVMDAELRRREGECFPIGEESIDLNGYLIPKDALCNVSVVIGEMDADDDVYNVPFRPEVIRVLYEWITRKQIEPPTIIDMTHKVKTNNPAVYLAHGETGILADLDDGLLTDVLLLADFLHIELLIGQCALIFACRLL